MVLGGRDTHARLSEKEALGGELCSLVCLCARRRRSGVRQSTSSFFIWLIEKEAPGGEDCSQPRQSRRSHLPQGDQGPEPAQAVPQVLPSLLSHMYQGQQRVHDATLAWKDGKLLD